MWGHISKLVLHFRANCTYAVILYTVGLRAILYWRKITGQLIMYMRWPACCLFQINYFWSLVLNGRNNRPIFALLLISIKRRGRGWVGWCTKRSYFERQFCWVEDTEASTSEDEDRGERCNYREAIRIGYMRTEASKVTVWLCNLKTTSCWNV